MTSVRGQQVSKSDRSGLELLQKGEWCNGTKRKEKGKGSLSAAFLGAEAEEWEETGPAPFGKGREWKRSVRTPGEGIRAPAIAQGD